MLTQLFLSGFKESLESIIYEGIGLNPWSFLAQIISTIILFLFLKSKVWKPMQEYLAKRSDVIIGELDSARALNEEAEANKIQSEEELIKIREKAAQLIEAARQEAEETKQLILKEAEQEALSMKEKAAQEIARDRQLAEAQIKENAVQLAFSAAEKLIQANLNTENNQKMIDDFIQGIGE